MRVRRISAGAERASALRSAPSAEVPSKHPNLTRRDLTKFHRGAAEVADQPAQSRPLHVEYRLDVLIPRSMQGPPPIPF